MLIKLSWGIEYISRVSRCIKLPQSTDDGRVIENKDGLDFNELAVQILEGHSKMALMVFNFFPNLALHTRALFLNDMSRKLLMCTFIKCTESVFIELFPMS